MLQKTSTWWIAFLACLFLFYIGRFWMMSIGRHFVTVKKNPFNIFDLEFPSSELSLKVLIRQMDAGVKKHVVRHLWVDFIFMAGAYPAIFLLCLKASFKMVFWGKWIFLILAFLQILPWLFDILENLYLLRMVKKGSSEPAGVTDGGSKANSPAYNFFQFCVKTKFLIALVGTVCSLFGLLYFWIVGDYQKENLPYLAVAFIMIVVFTLLGKVTEKKMA